MRSSTKPLVLAGLLAAFNVIAAEPQLGPVIENHGPVFDVPEGSFNLDPAQKYGVVMDIGKGPDDLAELNRSIESAALNGPAHEKHFGVEDANQGLLEELGRAGVKIYLCGQTAAYYGYAPNDLLPQVAVADSAMTVHARLQQEGYRGILF